MKSNLSDIVSKYLFSYGSVGIPGIGTFSISDSSSGFKLENDVLSPPTKMVDFSEEVSSEDALVKYLKNNHGYSRKEAEKTISDYSKRFLNDLLNYGVANIPGIGKLSKYASGEIVFDPAKEYLITSNYMLPEIKLTPIDNTGVVKELATKPEPIASKPAVAAIAGTIPTAATTAAFLGNKPEKKAVPPPVPQATPPPPIEKPQIKAEVKKEVKQTPAPTKPIVKKAPVASTPIKSTPPPVVYEEERSFLSEWKWPILLGLLLLGACIFGIKMCKKYTSGEGLGISNPISDLADKVTGKKDADVSMDDYLKDKPKLQKYAKFLTKKIVDDGCVIIVGTFKKSRNMIRMKDRILRAGLNPYTEVFEGMNRVGVLFPCEEHDLEEYITKLRKSFGKDAWFLNPPMDVPRN